MYNSTSNRVEKRAVSVSKNPKAGYASYFTNLQEKAPEKGNYSKRFSDAESLGARSASPSLTDVNFQHRESKPTEGSETGHSRTGAWNKTRYSSAPQHSTEALTHQQRSFSQPVSKIYDAQDKGFQSPPFSYSQGTESGLYSNSPSESGSEHVSGSVYPKPHWSGNSSGRTEVEWEKQRVQEMNMEWRQGHEKWRTRAEQVMQGYARELQKSLEEHPDALLKCP